MKKQIHARVTDSQSSLKSSGSDNQSNKNVLGMGELLNTQLVSKSDIQGKELRFMFGNKLNHFDKQIQEL